MTSCGIPPPILFCFHFIIITITFKCSLFFFSLLFGGCASLLLDFLHGGGSKVWWHVSLIILLKSQRQTDFYEDKTLPALYSKFQDRQNRRDSQKNTVSKQTNKHDLLALRTCLLSLSHIFWWYYLLFFLIFLCCPNPLLSMSSLNYHLFSLMILQNSMERMKNSTPR